MSHSSLAVGQVVAGRYRVERILGRGGMGEVAAVRHLELEETFALKVMTPEAFASQEAVERFIREARTSARLRSMHAVKVVDTGRLSGGAPFLVMEYLAGRDLERELAARGPLPVAEVAAYMIQACDVLSEAHASGIVHRDLKPANLFLTRLPNGAPCVKVLDFGIAKQSDPNWGSSMTQTTSVFGTPLYMSPEQMKSAKQVDGRSDLWSLGVVMYELLCRALPYDAESMTALVAKVMTEPPVPLGARRGGLPPGFEPVVMRCLEREPARRYQTAAELAATLAPYASAAAVPPTFRGSSPDLLAGSGGFAAYGAAGVAGAAGMPVVGAMTAGTQMSLTSQTGRAALRARSRTGLFVVATGLGLLAAVGVAFALRGGDSASSGDNAPPVEPAAMGSTGVAETSTPLVLPAPEPPAAATAAPEPQATASAAPSSDSSTQTAATTTTTARAPSTKPPATVASPATAPKTTATAATTASKPAPPPTTSAPATKPSGTRGGFL
ncbi:MAG: serine/threonine-protein kinase [Polyangiaceae bacterium]